MRVARDANHVQQTTDVAGEPSVATDTAGLCVQGPYDWHPAPQKLKAACRMAAKCCSDQGVSLRKLALQEAVKNTDMATQLVGMGTIQEVCIIACALQTLETSYNLAPISDCGLPEC